MKAREIHVQHGFWSDNYTSRRFAFYSSNSFDLIVFSCRFIFSIQDRHSLRTSRTRYTCEKKEKGFQWNYLTEINQWYFKVNLLTLMAIYAFRNLWQFMYTKFCVLPWPPIHSKQNIHPLIEPYVHWSYLIINSSIPYMYLWHIL